MKYKDYMSLFKFLCLIKWVIIIIIIYHYLSLYIQFDIINK